MLNQSSEKINAISSSQTQALGSSFMKSLESLRKDDLEWRKECRRWQTDLIQAIYLDDRSIEYRGGSIGAYLNLGGDELRVQFLEQLRFSDMTDRDDRISDAYEKTFTWIFKDDRSLWVNFVDWLRTDASIYWITGKPGSGKSTLMKYIGTHQRMPELLGIWAEPLPLITASFYLWNSGAEIQMSQTGLLRSLLFQVLNRVPDLLPRLFPERWEIASLFRFDRADFTITELRKAFSRLRTEVQGFKFCFFIDGLDEFSGDHGYLADFIIELAASPNVKVCTASRPWNVFEQAFQARPSLLLQTLTAKDIEYFVSSNFQKDADFAEFKKRNTQSAHDIVHAIVDKAAGVFLWVQLVVSSLLSGLKNGDRVSDLRKRIDLLPKDLRSLYEKILQSLDPFYLEHALQYFQLIKSTHKPLTLLDFSFADEDPDFVINCKVEALSPNEKRYRAETMRRRLNSRCKGLLEISYEEPTSKGVLHGPQSSYSSISATKTTMQGDTSLGNNLLLTEVTRGSRASSTVQYLHRTVKDFLEHPEVWSSLVSARTWSYDPHTTLLRAMICQFKTQSLEGLGLDSYWHGIGQVMDQARWCEEVSSDSCLQQNYIETLETFDQAAQELVLVAFPHYKHARWDFTAQPGSSLPKTHWTTAYRASLGAQHSNLSWGVGSFLSLAVALGLVCFVKARLQPECLERQPGGIRPLLISAVEHDTFIPAFSGSMPFPSLAMVKLLLSNSADPNYKIEQTTPWKALLEGLVSPMNGVSEMPQSYTSELLIEFLKHGAENPVRSTLLANPAFSTLMLRQLDARTVKASLIKPLLRKEKIHFQLVN